jgi:UDP-N-acetyl-D-mannosaminuronic acid dehydrogenase
LNPKEVFSLSIHEDVAKVPELLSALSINNRLGGFLPVVDESKKLVGIITDSDYRKSLIKEPKTISEIMNRNFVYLKAGMNPTEMARSLLEQVAGFTNSVFFPITYIPVVSLDGKITKVFHILELKPFIDELNREVVVFGQGFVGLTLSLVLASAGFKVYGVEDSNSRLISLKLGNAMVFEPSIQSMLNRHLSENFELLPSDELSKIVRAPFSSPRVYVVAVGTPLEKDRGPNLLQVKKAILQLSHHIRFGDLVIIRSTIPIGSTREFIAGEIEKNCGLEAGVDFNLAYCPERTVEGDAINELRKLPQLVGGYTPLCAEKAMNFFSVFVSSVVLMESLEACELAKLASNSYRDVIFGFANELSLIAQNWNVDINRMISEANSGYKRNNIPFPSPGVGGPCLTKDPYMLMKSSPIDGVIQSARRVNIEIVNQTVKRLGEFAKLKGTKTVLCLGVAFKGEPATNDLRNSTSVEICRKLEILGLRVFVQDLVASEASIVAENLRPLSHYNLNLIEGLLILNNHNQNTETAIKILNQEDVKIDWIFDPWSLLKPDDLKGKISHYLNMSMTQAVS